MSVADCFDYDRKLIPVADAEARLRDHAIPIAAPTTVDLRAAIGRILAQDICAPRDVPTFANAAVDGWAFCWQAGEKRTFRMATGRAAAGHPYDGRVEAGQALRILTGAALPDGVDSVALQEETRIDDGLVSIPDHLHPGANTRPAGEDMAASAVVLKRGHRLRAQDIGALALMGHAQVTVFTPLRVALLSTGDELLEPGQPHSPGKIYDANRPILGAMLSRLPVEVGDLGRLPDDRAEVERVLDQAGKKFDVIVSSGGASQGDEDHIARVMNARGRIHFWRIALKPGRPLSFGTIGNALLVGLPGNPVAATVCFAKFARPLILALAGQPWSEANTCHVPVAFSMNKHKGRTEMIRVTLRPTGCEPVADKVAKQGSGVLTSLVDASGLLEVGPSVERIEPGMRFAYWDFALLGLT